ncbi:oxysterol-binding protein-related protein 10-like isoform 2-T2 [Synchiropus picturatus]
MSRADVGGSGGGGECDQPGISKKKKKNTMTSSTNDDKVQRSSQIAAVLESRTALPILRSGPVRHPRPRGLQHEPLTLEFSKSRRGAMDASQRSGGTGISDAELEPTARDRKLEGLLKKYTNLLHGWQSRFFVLDKELSQLHYYLNEASRWERAPRGSLSLQGATVVISSYPHMFTVQPSVGASYKLKAFGPEEQNLWMTQLQLCSSDSRTKGGAHRPEELRNGTDDQPPPDEAATHAEEATSAVLSCLRDCLSLRPHSHDNSPGLTTSLGSADANDTELKSVNPQLQSDAKQVDPASAESRGGAQECVQRKAPVSVFEDSQPGSPPVSSKFLEHQKKGQQPMGLDAVDPNDESTDLEDNEEEDLGGLDDQQSLIQHLLSQLKLGMDLTRVTLPTFILEKRSLLEMYANFMAHPDIFLSISCCQTPEERMVRFVEYYLTAFHEGRKGAVAKKPYNPILGEVFRCSWHVPEKQAQAPGTGWSTVPHSAQSTGGSSDCCKVWFLAEQVSHHPPVSAFYCECKERKMCINAHIWTKSKFMGVSVGVSMVGEGVLYLAEHDEKYVFTLPCAYARSILAVPWVELGGKVSVSCAQSGYSAAVTFHTKPFCGGKVHRVTAEVRNNTTGNVVCKAQGEWNKTLEFTSSSGESKVVDTSKLPVYKKKIRPLQKQNENESRRIWQHVTSSLKAGNMDAATEHKRQLEERQRHELKLRTANKTEWKPKHFKKEASTFRKPTLIGQRDESK